MSRRTKNIKNLITISPRSLIKQTDDDIERVISYQLTKNNIILTRGKKTTDDRTNIYR